MPTEIQRHSIEILHGDKGCTGFFTDVVNSADIRMVECGAAWASRLKRASA